MTKMLQKHGNSHALIIDKAIMDATGITPETPLTVSVNGGCISIHAANVGLGPERVSASIAKLRPRYDEMLKNLAK